MPLFTRPPNLGIQGESSGPSYGSEEESSRFESHLDYSQTEEDWIDDDDEDYDDDDDVLPSDSASASNDAPPLRTRAGNHLTSRRHQVPRQHQQFPLQHQTPHLPQHQQHHRQQYRAVQPHVPAAASTVAHPEDYGHYGRGYQGGAGGPGGGVGGRGSHGAQAAYYGNGRQHAPAYGQNPMTPYMGGYPSGNQMVQYGNYAGHPFSPMSNGSNGASYFNSEGRGMYDMMPYGQQGYYNAAAHYGLPAHLQQFHISPPPPPPTEPPVPSTTPAPKDPPPPDPEKVKLAQELALFKAAQEKAEAAEKAKAMEAKIREDAEIAFQKRMDDMRRAQEAAKIEIEKAKAEAERAARERIEAERKAEEERQRQHQADMERAEERARMKFEAELKAADERRKKEDEDRARAEETARIRLEAAIKKEEEARAAAAQKAAEEAERLKQIEADAKRKAEADAIAKAAEEAAKAKAAAEAAAEAKKAAEELKKQIEEETKAKLVEDAKKKEKAPIRFKDAVGRKFSFPFHLCATWQGMEDLIKQAFLQVDVLGPHVQEGHYDLTGPNGEIILPSVWEKVVEPDWLITMTMWPMDKAPPVGPRPGGPPIQGRHPHGRGHMQPPIPPNHMRFQIPAQRRPTSAAPGGGVQPPPGWTGPMPRPPTGLPPDIINAAPPRPREKPKRNSALVTFFAGKPTKKKFV
ncbi:hypothetical protein S7711_07585 [Stachybotrys chartarum IBT 7711]|uniref:Ubiquitin-like domain-containing protein n=1 Tax=Stachybotrys chartarum (strain CBS 109288 / IBT 7711) TaxID=1280523 RepID=A0A084APZ6_STACB|nr:hypothetical protein S7711_07585 [Stachybotrys chartarum IBT 7711]KFA47071.1 hypothetical protein S40293_04610 [Stachybotrys chartarum IBT 40293]